MHPSTSTSRSRARVASTTPLLSRDHLYAAGLSTRAITASVVHGRLVRVHHGLYVRADDWHQLGAEERLVVQARATHRAAIRPPLFTHVSAAALLGLPLLQLPDASGSRLEGSHLEGADLDRSHIDRSHLDRPHLDRARLDRFRLSEAYDRTHIATAPTGPGRAGTDLIRHRVAVHTADITSVHGMHCTTEDRTLFDLARALPVEVGVACADAIVRNRFRRYRTIDQAALGSWRASMHHRLTTSPGARGARSLRQVIDLADPHADSVLESLSRLQLLRLGFDVETQVSVPAPGGGRYFVDFELRGLGVLGECDGRHKYSDPSVRGDATPAEVVYQEKRREDWISGTTGKRLIRWGLADATSPERLARLLTEYGILLPRKPGLRNRAPPIHSRG